MRASIYTNTEGMDINSRAAVINVVSSPFRYELPVTLNSEAIALYVRGMAVKLCDRSLNWLY